MNVPFIDLTREAHECHDEIIKECSKVVKSGQYVGGENVKTFENTVAEYLNVKHVISVGNGSDALVFILRSLGVSKGDEVICPSNSFIATGWAIAAVGAEPVFCDVENDFLMSTRFVEKLISEKTKVIMPVHLTGRVVDMESLMLLAKKHKVNIVEDAAQAFGAKDEKGKFAGAIGIAGAISLHPLKNLSVCGDGGLITTNSTMIAENCRLLRNHGLINRDEAKIWGYNSRLDEIQAAIGLIKMKRIEKWTKCYVEIAKFYDLNLNPNIKKPRIRLKQRDVYHNYVICVDLTIRDKMRKYLESLGVETKIHYPVPIHLQECVHPGNSSRIVLENTERLAKQMISLPIYPSLTEKEILFVSKSINDAYEIFSK